jgi:hypothetical protein
LSALAKEYYARTKDKYVAGHWRSKLPADLLWHAYDCHEFSRPYIAPTSSWASHNAGIVFEGARLEMRSPIAKIRSYSIELATDDPFGIISSGEWVIDAPFR